MSGHESIAYQLPALSFWRCRATEMLDARSPPSLLADIDDAQKAAAIDDAMRACAYHAGGDDGRKRHLSLSTCRSATCSADDGRCRGCRSARRAETFDQRCTPRHIRASQP